MLLTTTALRLPDKLLAHYGKIAYITRLLVFMPLLNSIHLFHTAMIYLFGNATSSTTRSQSILPNSELVQCLLKPFAL
jgi:hypothetical protein